MSQARHNIVDQKIVWLADQGSPHIQRWEQAFRKKGIKVKIISLSRRRPRLLYALDVIRIYKEIRKYKPDVVHAHYVSSYGVILSLIPYSCRKVISVWGSDVLVTPYKNRMFMWLVRRALLNADIRLANSCYLAIEAEKIAAKPFVVIPFGISLESKPFQVRNYKFERGKPFVIGINKRLHNVAGIDILLEAFSLAMNALADIQLKLIVIGDGPEKKKLQKNADQLNVSSSVEWLGWCEESVVFDELSKLDLVVFPSRVEGFGVSILEAMANGVPVMTSKVGGLVDLIGLNEERGVLFDPSSASLADAIILCVENYQQALDKSVVARQYIETEYNILTNAEALLKTYQESESVA